MKKLITLVSLVAIVGWGNVPASHHTGEMKCIVAPTSACTRDINVCGNSSKCQCQKDFAYNPTTGTCDLVFPSTQSTEVATASGASSYKPLCSFAPPNICTLDINPCGNPSMCICPLYYVYNPATGKCNVAFPVKKIQPSK